MKKTRASVAIKNKDFLASIEQHIYSTIDVLRDVYTN